MGCIPRCDTAILFYCPGEGISEPLVTAYEHPVGFRVVAARCLQGFRAGGAHVLVDNFHDTLDSIPMLAEGG